MEQNMMASFVHSIQFEDNHSGCDQDAQDEYHESENAMRICTNDGAVVPMLPDDYCLPNYEVVEVLGSGSSGTAILLHHVDTGLCVVDKIMADDVWNQVLCEVSFMAAVAGNKYFLSPLAYYKCPTRYQRCHLIMEHFAGENLGEFAMKNILTFSDLQFILRQTGEALLHMHRKGIIHVDIKPSNILINENMECKIIDFGLSMMGPKAAKMFGTEGYAAPEVIAHKYNENAPPFGYEADYYSLGLSILAIAGNLCRVDLQVYLLGEEGRRFAHAAYAVEDVLNPDGPDDDFHDLVSRLIEKDPEKRLHDGTFLSHPFFYKRFKNETCKISKTSITQKIKVKPERPRKRRGTIESRIEFETKVTRNKYARRLTARSFSISMDQIQSKCEVSRFAREKSLLWPKIKRMFKGRKEQKDETLCNKKAENTPSC